MTSLGLRGADLTEQGLALVRAALADAPHLHTLDVSRNRFSPEAVADVLPRRPRQSTRGSRASSASSPASVTRPPATAWLI